ncbi:helix-turn-helix domain-containing protein [bacterium]|nr:helix-turn-helix domain-containing protein [bacterium]
MNRNKNSEIIEIANILASEKDNNEIQNFIVEILTEAELETLSKRWRILKMLKEGRTQREIAQQLNVSLCKVTRGSKILKNKKSISAKYLTKENDNE